MDTVVALGQKGVLFLWDVGYFNVKACANIAAAGAYFFSRLHHQTNIYATVAGRLLPLELAQFLHTVQGNITEKAICVGAQEQVMSRLIASRVPETQVNKRRRTARKNAKKKGDTPSQAHLTLLAWNLFITNVPRTIWKAETVMNVYPGRWHIEIILKSWKSSLHFASITTKKEDPTLCYL